MLQEVGQKLTTAVSHEGTHKITQEIIQEMVQEVA